MDNIIKQLVELDHRGQEVFNDAEKYVTEKRFVFEQENQDERKKYIDNANDRINRYREEKNNEVNALTADRNEQYKIATEKMEKDFEQKKSKLVQQIFELCIE